MQVANVAMLVSETHSFKLGVTYEVKLGPGEGSLRGVCCGLGLLPDGRAQVQFSPYEHVPAPAANITGGGRI